MRSGFESTSSPSSVTCPEVASSRPARIFISVDLPAPLGPSRPNIPGGTSRLTPCSAVTGPGYTFTRSRMVSMRSLLARDVQQPVVWLQYEERAAKVTILEAPPLGAPASSPAKGRAGETPALPGAGKVRIGYSVEPTWRFLDDRQTSPHRTVSPHRSAGGGHPVGRRRQGPGARQA